MSLFHLRGLKFLPQKVQSLPYKRRYKTLAVLSPFAPSFLPLVPREGAEPGPTNTSTSPMHYPTMIVDLPKLQNYISQDCQHIFWFNHFIWGVAGWFNHFIFAGKESKPGLEALTRDLEVGRHWPIIGSRWENTSLQKDGRRVEVKCFMKWVQGA